MKKKNKNLFEIEVEDFKIYQVYRPKEHVFGRNRYISSTVASPYFGSQVVDKQTYVDVTGTANIDEGLDFVRKPEDKHLSKEDLIKKYGTEFYEYQILNNKKIDQITGYETKTEIIPHNGCHGGSHGAYRACRPRRRLGFHQDGNCQRDRRIRDHDLGEADRRKKEKKE